MTIQIQNDAGVKSNATNPQITQIRIDLGLGNVNNTADVNKPVSDPTAQAIADAVAAALAAAKAYTDSVVGSVPASVTSQPSGATLTSGQTLSLVVVGGGTPPLTYQWEKSANGTTGWANVDGAISATYSKTSVTGDTGYYRCAVDNAYGSPAYSNVVQVTVNAADVTAPVASSAAVADATPTIVSVIFSEAMNTSILPATSAFTVGGHTVTSLAWGTSTRLDITVTGAFANGEASRALAYTQPGSNQLRDMAGNLCASFSGMAITNNVLPVGGTYGLTTAPWEAPTEGGSFTNVKLYLGTASNVYTQTRTLASSALSAVVTGLPSAGPWYYAVAYVNAAGEGPIGIEMPALLATA